MIEPRPRKLPKKRMKALPLEPRRGPRNAYQVPQAVIVHVRPEIQHFCGPIEIGVQGGAWNWPTRVGNPRPCGKIDGIERSRLAFPNMRRAAKRSATHPERLQLRRPGRR